MPTLKELNNITPVKKEAPTEQKLRTLLAMGAESAKITCQELIDKWKLPFRIDGSELKSSFSDGELWLQKFITVDSDTLKMKERCLKMAASDYEVLIEGETGTGKETIAK